MCLGQGRIRKLSERRRTGLHATGLNDGKTTTFGINSGEGNVQFPLPLHFVALSPTSFLVFLLA